MKKKDDISDLYNQANGTVCILGAGPSIFYIDRKEIEKQECIYVNSDALLLSEKPDGVRRMWLSTDRLSMKWSYFWDNVVKSECVKLGSVSFKKYEKHLARFDFRYFEVRKKIEINNIFDGCLYGVSSVISAIDLALKMGYEKILLFGVDQRFIQGKSHFWQFYPPNKQPKFSGGKNVSMQEQKKIFEKNIPYFKELKRVASEMKVEIINCAKRTSALNVFPKLEEKECD